MPSVKKSALSNFALCFIKIVMLSLLLVSSLLHELQKGYNKQTYVNTIKKKELLELIVLIVRS